MGNTKTTIKQKTTSGRQVLDRWKVLIIQIDNIFFFDQFLIISPLYW